MELSEGIRKIGFRRWYERQLIESHLYLISGFLCLIAVIACLEGFSLRAAWWETVIRFSGMVGGAAVCLWTLRCYLTMLDFAEFAAERSVCEKCAAYRGLELSGAITHRTETQGEDEEGGLSPLGVRCRKCGHEWTIG